MEIEVLNRQKTDEKYMRRAIQLAKNGVMGTAPNPMVGAVIVCDDRIIGEGYHRKCGGPHAEVNAVNSVRQPELLPQSTIYVTLEPCSHYGKTPPCAQLLIDKRVRRVVVGCGDPNEKVNGRGIQMLRDAGIEVEVGVLEEECRQLNPKFMTLHTQKRPRVILKWAQSRDGYIDREREFGDCQPPVLFSTPITQAAVHKLRAECDAILVGARTAICDNPSLTTRAWDGSHPLRLVLDMRASLPSDLQVFDGSVPTRVYVTEDAQPLYYGKVDVVQLCEDYVEEQIMADLVALHVQSLIVEGGSRTLQRFINAGLWDECRVEIAPISLGGGMPAPQLKNAELLKIAHLDGHIIQFFTRKV